VSRKKDRSDLTLFIPFELVCDYLFDDPIYMQGFPGIFCHILGVKVMDLVSLTHSCPSSTKEGKANRAEPDLRAHVRPLRSGSALVC